MRFIIASILLLAITYAAPTTSAQLPYAKRCPTYTQRQCILRATGQESRVLLPHYRLTRAPLNGNVRGVAYVRRQHPRAGCCFHDLRDAHR
jgi:hypothetical protein